jgi:uncharacterized UBP type Zn finger protein
MPDQAMMDQLASMGYPVNVVKEALITVANESVAVALDEIEGIMEKQKSKVKKLKPKTDWFCP